MRAVAGRPRPSPALLALVVLVAALAVGAGAAAAQQPRLPPGSEAARFRMVVEGEATAVSDVDAASSSGLCDAQINAHTVDEITYRRGRGVLMEFVRIGAGRRSFVLLRRAGRVRDATFSVDVSVTRRSRGFASRTPTGLPPEACPPVTDDLSQGPECGVPQRLKAAMALVFRPPGLFDIRLAGLGALLPIECPVSRGQVFQGSLDTRWGWPTLAPLRRDGISPRELFGRRRVIVLRLVAPQARESHPFVSGPLVGSYDDIGRHRATLRLIRVT